jgi:serine/threonine protein kinase/Tol biopolymer transport system component
MGPYEILAPIGAGGMGEVYKARDTRLDRIVALKTSAEQFTERFEREARSVAALNHPNICTIHDVGPDYLVMEFIEGPTLAERIAQGRVPLDEAIPLARQIAEALEAAHEKGIVHRDLKPANIKLTPEGTVKVLDFGLAKAFDTQAGVSVANSPTLTMGMTSAGMILGTAGYMSPEQAKGRVVDKRADIWSFGVVLMEMLGGRTLYEGETVAETLASVIKDEPSWAVLPADTPPAIRGLLRRCLEKDPKLRLRDIGEARILLANPDAATPTEAPATAASTPAPSPRRAWLPWSLAAALLIVATALGWLAYHHVTEQPQVARLYLLPPEKTTFAQRSFPTLSPDGRKLTFVAGSGTDTQLWVRDLDSLVARPLPGASGANDPFWSPDSRTIGFFSEGKLRKIDTAGGPAQALCNAPNGRGGAWNREGVILFTPGSTAAIFRVSSAGGQPVQVTTIEPSKGERSHRFPAFLPDGRHFLFLSRGDRGDIVRINLGDLESKEHKQLFVTESHAVYVPPGLILYIKENTLLALPFDSTRLQATGEPFPIVQPADLDRANNKGGFTVSQTGVLAYFGSESGRRHQLKWFDSTGKELGVVGPASSGAARLSPDGETVAIDPVDRGTSRKIIWLLGLARGANTRFTFGDASTAYPVWSPDGSRVAYTSYKDGQVSIMAKPANGAAGEETLYTSKGLWTLADWSRDGRYLIVNQTNGYQALEGIGTIDLQGERKLTPYNPVGFSPRISPDGRWMMYVSNESGRPEVFVQNFPTPTMKFQISTAGSYHGLWSHDGRQIFYIALDRKMMAVDVKTGDNFEAGNPRALFQTRTAEMFDTFSTSPDDRRFLIPAPPDDVLNLPLTVVLNWPEALRK